MDMITFYEDGVRLSYQLSCYAIRTGLSLAFNCHSHGKASVPPKLLRPQAVTRASLLSGASLCKPGS